MQWNKYRFIISAYVVAAMSMSGCATTTPALEAHSSHFGDAIAQNIAAQRIAPTAKDKANTFIPPNRARQKAAREAYENGTVAEPVSVTTTGDE